MPRPKQYARKTYTRKAKVPDGTKQYVKKAITRAKDKKYHPVEGTLTSMAYDVDVPVNMSAIAQGTTMVQRLGEVIKLKAFYMRAQINFPLVISSGRVVILQWKPSSTAEIPSWDVLFNRLKNTAIGVHGIKNDESLDKSKFNILYDKTFYNTAGIAGSIKNIYIKLYEKKFGNKMIKFEPLTNDGAGHLYMYVSGNQTASVGACSITYATRLIFEDN